MFQKNISDIISFLNFSEIWNVNKLQGHRNSPVQRDASSNLIQALLHAVINVNLDFRIYLRMWINWNAHMLLVGM